MNDQLRREHEALAEAVRRLERLEPRFDYILKLIDDVERRQARVRRHTDNLLRRTGVTAR